MSSSSSSSESIVPPAGHLVSTDRGLTAWSAVFDTITIDKLPAGMRAFKVVVAGASVVDKVLTAEQAAHLAKLLSD